MDVKELIFNETVVEPDVRFIYVMFMPFFFAMLIIQLSVVFFMGFIANNLGIPDSSIPMVFLLLSIMKMINVLMLIYVVGVILSWTAKKYKVRK